jgi:hypothetical protein
MDSRERDERAKKGWGERGEKIPDQRRKRRGGKKSNERKHKRDTDYLKFDENYDEGSGDADDRSWDHYSQNDEEDFYKDDENNY